jgi:hypothetical protein
MTVSSDEFAGLSTKYLAFELGEFQSLSRPHTEAAFFTDTASQFRPTLSTPVHAITYGFAVCLSDQNHDERMWRADTDTKKSTSEPCLIESLSHVSYSG